MVDGVTAWIKEYEGPREELRFSCVMSLPDWPLDMLEDQATLKCIREVACASTVMVAQEEELLQMKVKLTKTFAKGDVFYITRLARCAKSRDSHAIGCV